MGRRAAASESRLETLAARFPLWSAHTRTRCRALSPMDCARPAFWRALPITRGPRRVGNSQILRSCRADADVVIVYSPMENEIIRRLAPRHVVYWTGDEVTMADEAWLVDASSAVIAISDRADEEKQRNAAGRTHRLATGVPFEMFSSGADNDSVPAEMACLPRPIFGYAGALNSRRVDATLIAATARAHPTGTVVLIGPEESGFLALDAFPGNVVRLGPKPYAELPRYLAAFDVGLIPYLLNAFNLGSDPLKAHEYLAVGLPVVASRLPAFEHYRELISIADSPSEFARVAGALVELRRVDGLIRARRSAARGNGVDKIADSIKRILDDLDAKRGRV